jgi:hypothetical protein
MFYVFFLSSYARPILTSCPFWNSLAGCRQLKHLVLLFCQNLSDDLLQKMSLNLRLLEHVELDGCRSITDVGITSLISGSPGLKKMSLSMCSKLSNASLIDIIRRLKDLEHLRILLTWHTPDCVSRARKSLPYSKIDYLYRDAVPAKLPDVYGPYGTLCNLTVSPLSQNRNPNPQYLFRFIQHCQTVSGPVGMSSIMHAEAASPLLRR